MKKYLLTILLALAFIVNANAEEKKVLLHPIRSAVSQTGNHHERTPPLPLYAYQGPHSLSFDMSFAGLSIKLLQDDEVVYSDIIDENGEVLLPDYLVGEYELRFYLGSIIFVGEIEL